MSDSQHHRIQAIIRHIIATATNISLYGSQHPQILKLCDKALEECHRAFRVAPVYVFKVIDHRLICNHMRLEPTLATERLRRQLETRKIRYFEISAHVDRDELLKLAQALSGTDDADLPRDLSHVRFGQLQPEKVQPAGSVCDFSELAGQHCDRFMDAYRRARKKQAIPVPVIAEIVDDFIEAFRSHSRVMMALAPLRSMDEYAYVHSTNICLLNLAQARLLGIDGQTLNDIGIAAMLHDVGKLFIPADILNKPGKPDEKEWNMIKQHPRLGAEYLVNTPGVPYLAVINAFEHHIGYDGKGYPSPGRPRQLSVCSHMTTISDIYDALRTRRSYKEPLPFSGIREIMTASMGKSLHPQLTRSFLDAMGTLEGDQVRTDPPEDHLTCCESPSSNVIHPKSVGHSRPACRPSRANES